MAARSTHCAAGIWAALACGGGEFGDGEGCGVVPGSQTASAGGTKVAGGEVETGAGVLVDLRADRRPDVVPRASPAAFAGAVFRSGFMMLTAGIDAELGKSILTSFFWP
jgi:hypothetical protein